MKYDFREKSRWRPAAILSFSGNISAVDKSISTKFRMQTDTEMPKYQGRSDGGVYGYLYPQNQLK